MSVGDMPAAMVPALVTATRPISMSERHRLHMRLVYDYQPSGLRTGSPSSPPPHL